MSWDCDPFIQNCVISHRDRGDGVWETIYNDDCLRYHEEQCPGNVASRCTVTCTRMGRRGSSDACEETCVDHFRNFKFDPVSRQRRLQGFQNLQNPEEHPPCTDALLECKRADGTVDRECLNDYKWCWGTPSEQCAVACIKTPGPECQDQCRTHSTNFIPPLRSKGLANGASRKQFGRGF